MQDVSRGVPSWVKRGRQVGVAGVLAALAGGVVLVPTQVTPFPSASAAAVQPGGTIKHNHYASTAGGSCALSPSTNPPASSPPTGIPASGGSQSWSSEDVRTLLNNGAPIGGSRTATSTTASFSTTAGGLGALAITTRSEGSVSAYQACSGSGAPISATAVADAMVVQPVTRAGWLDISASSSGIGAQDRATYNVYLRNPADPSSTGARPVLASDVVGSARNRVYLPAGWIVGVSAYTYFALQLPRATSAPAGHRLDFSLRATFTPAGAALNGAHGKRFARRSVVLPSAVSCSGSAAVRLTRYAKKNAKSVTFLVNGHVVRKVKRIKRARTLGIRVPTSGPITISAKVTPKHGKKARVTRSYAACR